MALINGKCEKCVGGDMTSVVNVPQMGATTLMGVMPPYYDEEGVFHESINPNRTTYTWWCSKGHTWNEVR